MEACVVLEGLVIILFLLFYGMRKRQMRVFKKMGIPGPEPNFLFGNLLAFISKPMFRKYQDWRQEFGETYGYFEGPTPVLVTSNVDLIQEVFIKQFNKFHARKLWPVQVDPDNDEDVHMFFARGRRWKRLRNVVNPAFSASKIRQMAPTVDDSINQLLDVIRDTANSKADQSVEVLNLFRRLTLDSILRCEVGIEQNSVKNPDDPFLKHCKGVIDDTTKMPWLYLLGFIFPSLHRVWIAVYKLLHHIKFNPVFWLEDRMREVVTLRRKNTETKRGDLMQQMLDAQFKAESFKDIETDKAKKDPSMGNTLRSMTNEEIVSHALLFLLAGYETTSTTLSYLFFELSQNPTVQQCLRREIMTVLPRGYCQIAYDDLKQLTYLDYVIWEALRKYPLASSVTARQCVQSCTVHGLDFPEGLLVHANLWDVQYDPQHWGDNPHQFDPLRFLPEIRKTRHPAAWMPFGAGPRSCAGLRFALLQLKMVVAKVLRDFDFKPCDHQKVPLRLVEGATVLPADGICISALRRASAMTELGVKELSSVIGLTDKLNSRRSSLTTGSRRSSLTVGEMRVGSRRDSLATEEITLVESRRSSLTPSEDGRESDAEEDIEVDMEASWKSYLARRRNSRRSSILDDEPTQESICDIRRASITKGIEKQQTDASIRQSLFLRRASCDVNFLSGVPSDETANNTAIQSSPCSQTSSYNKIANSSTTVGKADPIIPTWTSPKDTNLPGLSNFLRSRLSKRRASALPDLHSVRESFTLSDFNYNCQGEVNHDITSVSRPPIPDDMDKDKLITWLDSSPLFKRRASG